MVILDDLLIFEKFDDVNVVMEMFKIDVNVKFEKLFI